MVVELRSDWPEDFGWCGNPDRVRFVPLSDWLDDAAEDTMVPANSGCLMEKMCSGIFASLRGGRQPGPMTETPKVD